MNNNVVENYIEKELQIFYSQKRKFLQKIKLNDLINETNFYIYSLKEFYLVGDLIEILLNQHLSSQEETLFEDFMEGLATFVCNKVYGAKKSDLVGMDLEFEKDDVIYVIEIKAGWNWGNGSQIKQLKINAKNAKEKREKETGKCVKVLNGCCFGKKKNRNPEKDGYQKICGQEFWHLISNDEEFYIKIVEPIGFKAKEKNEEFQEAYAILINKFTLEFAIKFCDDGKINWEKLLQFNSGKKNR